MKTNSLTRTHYIAYAITLLCLIVLFFTNQWEAGFYKMMMTSPYKYNFTLKKIGLVIINLSLLASITKPLKNEDERVEKIKNYVRVHIFFLVLSVVLIIGLFFNTNVILLAMIAVVLIYYITIFWICIYRDPAVLYMSEKDMIEHNKTMNKKYKIHYIRGGLIGIVIFILSSNHRFDLVPIGLFGVTYTYFLIGSIYLHLKS